ncbi:MAG: hypothetical protein PVI68_11555, partial [Anaerolineae bacterium]
GVPTASVDDSSIHARGDHAGVTKHTSDGIWVAKTIPGTRSLPILLPLRCSSSTVRAERVHLVHSIP